MNLEKDRFSPLETLPSDNGEHLARVVDAPAPDTAPEDPPDKDLDPFDPERLRLPQDYASQIGVKKLLLTVPVTKPGRDWWVRTHPDDAYWLETAVLEQREDRETYLVAPELRPELSHEASFVRILLILSVSRQKVLFLWPIRLAGEDGKLNVWHASAIEAAQKARDRWIRLSANMSLGAYDVMETTADLSAPEWPDKDMRELLSIAFKRYYIADQDHAILRKLRGEV